MTTGWRQVAAVTAATAAVLVASALPWYGMDWSVSDWTGSRVEHSRANVWQFSSVWSVAVALGGRRRPVLAVAARAGRAMGR